MKHPFLTPVLVKWLDAVTDPSHELNSDDPDSIKEFGGLVECEDIGFYVKHNADAYVIALSRSQVGETVQGRHATTIPSGWILEVHVLGAVGAPSS